MERLTEELERCEVINGKFFVVGYESWEVELITRDLSCSLRCSGSRRNPKGESHYHQNSSEQSNCQIPSCL